MAIHRLMGKDLPDLLVSEKAIEDVLYERLVDMGLNVKRQVQIGAGVVDIITDEAIYEVKYKLDRDSVFRGTGQLMIYSQHFKDKSLRMVGLEHSDLKILRPYLRRLGIHVYPIDLFVYLSTSNLIDLFNTEGKEWSGEYLYDFLCTIGKRIHLIQMALMEPGIKEEIICSSDIGFVHDMVENLEEASYMLKECLQLIKDKGNSP